MQDGPQKYPPYKKAVLFGGYSIFDGAHFDLDI